MAAQGSLQLTLLVPDAHTVAVTPGVALALDCDAPLLDCMELQWWISWFGLGLATFTGAGHQRPGFEFFRWLSQPGSTMPVSEAGMQTCQLLIQLSIISAAPGTLQQLQCSAGHLGQGDAAPASEKFTQLVHFRFTGLVTQQIGGQCDGLTAHWRDCVVVQCVCCSLQVALNSISLQVQQLTPDAECCKRSACFQCC